MIRCVQDVAYPSAQVYPPNNTGAAFQIIPILEGFDATVLDDRAFPATGIPLGTLYTDDYFATGSQGDAFYAPSQQQAAQIPLFSYGILTAVPLQPQGYSSVQLQQAVGNTAQAGVSYGTPTEVRIRQKGTCLALCTTASSAYAIAPGTPLCADGNGNLQPFQPPASVPTPTVTPIGGSATSYSYALVGISADGVATAIGTNGTTAAGAATLTNAAYNVVSWTPTADAEYYLVLRTASAGTPATVGTIGVVAGVPGATSQSFNDTGIAILANTSATQAFSKLAAPGAPTVAQVAGATAGLISYTYTVYAIDVDGVWSAASGGTAVTTGAAQLSPTQGNKITWGAVAGSLKYAVFRTVVAAGGAPTSVGFIGYSNSPTGGLIDYGQAANTAIVAQTVPNPTPRNGACLGIAKGTLAAGTTTPTLTLVEVGGF